MGRDCKYCGAYISDMVNVCTACGRKVKPEKPPEYDTYYRGSTGAAAQTAERESHAQEKKEKAAPFYTDYTDTKREKTSRNSCTDAVESDKLAILCYFGPLFLIPYFLRPNEFVRFHCNQGLLLLLAGIVLETLGLGALAALFQIYSMILGIKSVLHSEKKQIPFIGGIRLLK